MRSSFTESHIFEAVLGALQRSEFPKNAQDEVAKRITRDALSGSLGGKAGPGEGTNAPRNGDDDKSSSMTGGYNQIPASRPGSCHRCLLVLCYDKDSLSERLREMLYHVGIYCQGTTTEVLFITSTWDYQSFEAHKKAVSTLKDRGIRFNFLLIGTSVATRLL